ncbi:MAG: alpha/beta hydrolase [Pseudomonadota bacterium]|nr:alpha/beta hydrolase [Pseudomonadota bacterium]
MRLPDGRRIGYAEYGDPDGVAVLALHGTPGSRIKFRAADALAARLGVRLIAPDRAGYGGSTPKPGRGLAAAAGDLFQLANALGIGEFTLVGISGGGPHAAACAALGDGRVRALGLVGPVGPIRDPVVEAALPPKFRRIFALGRHPLLARVVFTAIGRCAAYWPGLLARGLMQRACAADRPLLRRADVAGSLAASFAEGIGRGVEGAMEDARMFAEPWDFDPALICVPTVVWQGSEDGNVPPAAAIRLARLIPGCEMHLIEGAGHYWVYDHFDEVLRTLLDRADRRHGTAGIAPS